MTEEQSILIDQAKHGDQRAYSKLYKQYYNLLRYIIFDLVKNEDITKDLISTTFTKAFQKIDSYINPISFEAWLKTIAVNTVIDHIRSTKNLQSNISIDNEDNLIQLPTLSNPEIDFINSQSVEYLKIALSKLRTKYRRLLEEKYFNNLSYEELSVKLGIPVGTVKSDLHKAKRKLKYYFQKLTNN